MFGRELNLLGVYIFWWHELSRNVNTKKREKPSFENQDPKTVNILYLPASPCKRIYPRHQTSSHLLVKTQQQNWLHNFRAFIWKLRISWPWQWNIKASVQSSSEPGPCAIAQLKHILHPKVFLWVFYLLPLFGHYKESWQISEYLVTRYVMS